jgi:hypothetical protein
MTYFLDRFEESFALLEAEDGTVVQLARNLLPKDAAEGTALRQEQGNWVCCKEETEARAARIAAKMNLLWQKKTV